jgi:dTDP-glucose 4,6-dehydratase
MPIRVETSLGHQPPDLDRISEDYQGAPRPEDLSAGYGHGKRAAEFLCAAAASETELKGKVARRFAFFGLLLPLDGSFAIGNFIRDALYRDRIEVAGDGKPRRSYLYAADLAVWLRTILLRGESGRPYNVGSEADVSISDLARLVAERFCGQVFPCTPPSRCRPRRRLRATFPRQPGQPRELGVQSHVVLDDAVLRTTHCYRAGPTSRLRAAALATRCTPGA